MPVSIAVFVKRNAQRELYLKVMRSMSSTPTNAMSVSATTKNHAVWLWDRWIVFWMLRARSFVCSSNVFVRMTEAAEVPKPDEPEPEGRALPDMVCKAHPTDAI